MRILYSKQSLKFLLQHDEKYVSRVLATVKDALESKPNLEYIPLPKVNDNRRAIHVVPYYVVVQKKRHNNETTFYVTNILDAEDLEYYD